MRSQYSSTIQNENLTLATLVARPVAPLNLRLYLSTFKAAPPQWSSADYSPRVMKEHTPTSTVEPAIFASDEDSDAEGDLEHDGPGPSTTQSRTTQHMKTLGKGRACVKCRTRKMVSISRPRWASPKNRPNIGSDSFGRDVTERGLHVPLACDRSANVYMSRRGRERRSCWTRLLCWRGGSPSSEWLVDPGHPSPTVSRTQLRNAVALILHHGRGPIE